MNILKNVAAIALMLSMATGNTLAQTPTSADIALQKAMENQVNGFQHIGIPTKNIAATEAFWGKLGFKVIGSVQNGPVKVRFLKRDDIMIETWESPKEALGKAGAMNHIALDTNNVDVLYPLVKKAGFTMIDHKVMSLPFWEKGIKYFNIKGPNGEIVEFCERVK